MSAAPAQHRRAFISETAAIRPLDLPDLLPVDARLVMQEEIGLVALLSVDEVGQPSLVAVQLFTPSEWSLLVALFRQHPNYCPYEVLLAHLTFPAVTEPRIDRLREQLNEARDDGTWDMLMRPVRNVLSRVRLKLRPFGIRIISLLETGYTLQPARDSRRDGGTSPTDEKGRSITHATDTR